MNSKTELTRGTVDQQSHEIHERASTLMDAPANWIGRATESTSNRKRRQHLREKVIARAIGVQSVAAEEAVKSCQLAAEYEFQQACSRELIRHRGEVTQLHMVAQHSMVEKVTTLMEKKVENQRKLETIDADQELIEYAQQVIGEAHIKAAQDLIDRNEE